MKFLFIILFLTGCFLASIEQRDELKNSKMNVAERADAQHICDGFPLGSSGFFANEPILGYKCQQNGFWPGVSWFTYNYIAEIGGRNLVMNLPTHTLHLFTILLLIGIKIFLHLADTITGIGSCTTTVLKGIL